MGPFTRFILITGALASMLMFGHYASEHNLDSWAVWKFNQTIAQLKH